MRLLEHKPNGELSLTRDLNSDTTLYAILSHTWGNDGEEVTFDDMVGGTGQHKPGTGRLSSVPKRRIETACDTFG